MKKPTLYPLYKKTILYSILFILCFSLQAQVNFATSGFITGAAPTAAATYLSSTGVPGTLHNFVITDATYSNGVVEGPDGKLYGTARNGGTNNNGLVFSVEADGSNYTVIYNISASQSIQYATPVFGPDGKIYINISNSLYRIEMDGSAAAVVAALPAGGSQIVIDNAGWIFARGFEIGNSILYKIKTDGTGYQLLHTFNTAVDGGFDNLSAVCITPTDRLFGQCTYGGLGNRGTLFSLKKDGSDFIIHQSFDNTVAGESPVRYGAPAHYNGKIFFANSGGGTNFTGMLLSFDTTLLTLAVVFQFPAGDSNRASIQPKIANNTIMGLSKNGLYRLNPDGSNFQKINTFPFGNDNYSIFQQLTYSPVTNQVFYIADGGVYKNGYLLKMDATALTNFDVHDFGNVPGGYNPSGIFKATDGKLYGITQNGGAAGGGTIFKMNTDGSAFQTIYDFNGANGQSPIGQLLLAADGRLYGVCNRSGVSGLSDNRLIFGINTDGTNYTVLKIFTNAATDGRVVGELTEGTAGSLYGVTGPWGDRDDEPSIIFKIATSGTGYTVLKTFNTSFTEGKVMRNRLTFYSGFLYGTFALGGNNSAGTAFRINENGTGFTVIKHFSPATEGVIGIGGLTLASNNILYGSTAFGGSFGSGTVFTINPSTLGVQVIYNFPGAQGDALSSGKFLQASNGRLYKLRTPGLFGIDLNGSNATYVSSVSYQPYQSDIFVTYLTEIPFSILPLKLVKFTVQKMDKAVALFWQTEQEINTKAFEIQRSSNSRDFATFLSVAAKSNTVVQTDYTATDNNPRSGKNYYRLKMIDNDGAVTYSDIKQVKFAVDNSITVFPNPVAAVLNIKNNIKGSQFLITVTDAAGRIVKETMVTGKPVVSVSLQGIGAGVYTVRVKSGDIVYSSSFIKQ
jgi:uncharacterized repeat protein (TIGR03803 family)